MKTRVIIAGKFDPIHDGHLDHILKASKLGDSLTIITHLDDTIARNSKKGFCAVPLWARDMLLRGILELHQIEGEVVVATNYDGTCGETLRAIRRDHPKDTLIFAKGGDRSDASKMPLSEIKICEELDIEIRYGVGDLLNSSTRIVS